MRSSTKWLVGIVVIAAVGFIAFRMSGNAVAEPGKYDEFARCVTASGAVMYGAYWCPHCANQKEIFGDSFDYITYVECDPRGDNAEPQRCEENGVQGYPTWIFSDGERRSGEISLRELEFRTSCKLPE